MLASLSRARYRLASVVSVALLATAVFSCADSTIPKGIAGFYVLESINDQPIPVVVVDEPDFKLEVLQGSFTIDAIPTYSTSGLYRQTEGGETFILGQNTNGSYTRKGTAIFFKEEDGTLIDGTLSNGVLTVDMGGFSAVFRRMEQ
jgi:hypothetical protein